MSGLGFSGITSGGSPVRFSHRPVDLGQGPLRQGVRYPNPFFDAAQTYFPARLKQMLRWCRYFFFTNPLINAVVYKLAEYPVTEIIYDTDEESVRTRYKSLFEDQLQIRKFQIEVGLDYYNYGNAFITVSFPFVKHLQCHKCGFEKPIKELRDHYRFVDLKYYLTCPKCGDRHPARVHDRTIKSPGGIRLIRWDPERIEIDDNDGVTDPVYYYDLPQKLRNSITIGKRSVIEKVPDLFIEGVRKRKAVTFSDGNIFHLKRPIIAQKDQGWGMPLVLPVLKDLFYLQILRKGQEMIAQEHIVPLRVLFPAAGSSTSDPATMINLQQWRDDVQEELARWRQDPNYVPIMPVPLGHEMIGGNGRAMILHQELRVWSEQVVAGMNVPLEFIFGGLQYTGSNVSMRMLENQFIGYRIDQLRMVRDFIMGRVCEFLGWPTVGIRFRRFRMADDLQRLMIYFQANQAMKISDTTFLRELGEELAVEEKRKKDELAKQIQSNRDLMVAQAAAQGESNLVMIRYEIQSQKLQSAMGMPPAPAGQLPAPGGEGQPGMEGAQPGMAGGGQPGAEGGQPGMEQGPAGGPMQGEEIAPGVPDNATVYPENAQQSFESQVQSPMAAGRLGGMDIRAVAQRVAAAMRQLEQESPHEMQQSMQRLKMSSPELYRLVVQLLAEGDGGRRSTLNPMQQPLPEQKPPRRGIGEALV